ncbi:MAG: hypothetical protein ACOYON_11005 [Fimbriimonas sp.]
MSKRPKVGCLIVVGVVAALVLLGIGWWAQGDNMGSDAEFERIVAPAALRPTTPVPESENWHVLIQPFRDKIPRTDPRTDEIDEAVFRSKGGRDILALSRAIAKRPKYDSPNRTAADFNTSDAMTVRALAKFLAAHARHRFDQGDWKTAFEDLDIVEHLGLSFSERGFLVDWLVGLAVVSIGNRERADAFLQGRVPKSACIEWASRPVPDRREEFLQALRRDINGFAIATMRTGRYTDASSQSTAPEPDPSFFDLTRYSEYDSLYFGRYQRIETARAFAELLKASDVDVRAPVQVVPPKSSVLMDDLEKKGVPVPVIIGLDTIQGKWEVLKYRTEIRSRPNGKGLLILRLLPFYNTGGERAFRAQEAFIRLSAAIGAFRLDQRKFPPDLETLVNKGLIKEVPADPFDGMPIRYDAKRKILWTVSSDGKDDDGDNAKDRVWRLTPKPPTPGTPVLSGPPPGFIGGP